MDDVTQAAWVFGTKPYCKQTLGLFKLEAYDEEFEVYKQVRETRRALRPQHLLATQPARPASSA